MKNQLSISGWSAIFIGIYLTGSAVAYTFDALTAEGFIGGMVTLTVCLVSASVLTLLQTEGDD